MRDVVIALIPAVAVSVVFYGLAELLVLAVSVISCVALEYLITKYLLKAPSTVGDWSAAVTGILLALNLPASTPWWVVFIGAVVAIGVAKMTFGGLGQNVFNPALVGRVFLLISFPTNMTDWAIPGGVFGADAVSGATPLGVINVGLMKGASAADLIAQNGFSASQMLFANIGGSAGEASAIAILIGFVYLLVRKVIKPWITLSILGTVALLSTVFWMADPTHFTGPLFNLLTGSPSRFLFHGNRLCDLSDEYQGRNHLRCGHRFHHFDDQVLRILSGRSELRYSYHELCGSAS